MDSKALAKRIGQKVQDVRLAQGLTQAQLASIAGVSDRLIRSIESGAATGISLDKLSSILTVLGLSLEFTDLSTKRKTISQDDDYETLLKNFVGNYLDLEAHDE